ncbi:MAG: hypothetical protein U1E54_01300 [Candidatus Levybacteria bacterium]|nr:hypothetical protein [Candidatus Levybacteria bacterium]
MKKKKIKKAWCVIGGNHLIEVGHGEKEKQVIGYSISKHKSEVKNCVKFHCDSDNFYKVVPCQITFNK